MKSLFVSLCLLASASAEFLVPAWTAQEEGTIQKLSTELTPELRKHCVMVGRLGLSEIRPAVFLNEKGDLLAPYLKPIDGDDEAPYLIYFADGSRRAVETIIEKSERGIALLTTDLPEGFSPAPIAPDQSIISCHWFFLPVTAPIPKVGEPIAFATTHLFPRPDPEAVSFLLEDIAGPAGTPVFDLAGRLIAMTNPTEEVPSNSLLISRLAEDLVELREALPESAAGDLPRLPLSPKIEKDEEEEEDSETPDSPLTEARETFARSLMPEAPPYALIFNDDKAVTHSVAAVIIRSDGLLLTKASELGPELTVRYGGQSHPAALLATDEATDLALVGIAASDLPVVEWSSPDSLVSGASVISPILLQETSDEMVASDSMGLGTFSHFLKGDSPTLHAASEVTSLGIVTEQSSDEVRVASIDPDSPAAESDLQIGDQIMTLEERKITSRTDLTDLLSKMRVGMGVSLTVKRGEETKTVLLPLTRPRLTPPPTGITMETGLLLIPSVRRFGFEQSLVHSLPLNAWDCGSPLYDLSGKALGLNISASSANRSLALPPALVEAAVQRMLSSSDPF
ncbi:MAG: PDZ domain-containing protein [Akkermansiaceae bacterium]